MVNYEKKIEKINKENEEHLNRFAKWLEKQGASLKTIKLHVNNVDFYINDYLCYYEAQTVKHGCKEIKGFLGDWFIRKALWSSCSNIKSNATSIKKFYLFMLGETKISQDDYENLCQEIKEFMPEWLENMKEYDISSL